MNSPDAPVPSVQGEAAILRSAALAIGHADNCWPDADRDPYIGCCCRMSLVWAYADRLDPTPADARTESEGRS